MLVFLFCNKDSKSTVVERSSRLLLFQRAWALCDIIHTHYSLDYSVFIPSANIVNVLLNLNI